MGCYRCGNLDTKKKSAGKAGGNLYYCKKAKTFVNPAKFSCDKFKKADRKEWQKKNKNNKTKISGRTYIYILYFVIWFIMIVSSFKSSNQFSGLLFLAILMYGFGGLVFLSIVFFLWDCFITVLTKRND